MLVEDVDVSSIVQWKCCTAVLPTQLGATQGRRLAQGHQAVPTEMAPTATFRLRQYVSETCRCENHRQHGFLLCVCHLISKGSLCGIYIS